VSTIPVREALQMLQSEGLTVNVPHVGATVAPVSRASVTDVFTTLEGLELVATRLVAERAAPGDIHVLEMIVHHMDVAVNAKRYEDWAALNTQFHLTLGELPGLPLLHEMTARVLDHWHRVRRYFFKGVLLHRVERAQREHRDLLAALQARDLDAVARVVHEHNAGALQAYMSYLDTGSGNGDHDDPPARGAEA
jgi:DNA-binding GntR family transcriptional regulator